MYQKAGCRRGHVPRRGFTIIEMVVATFLTALLALLLAGAVATFARPAAEVDGRTRLALEASLAAETLARDLGGYLVDGGVPGKLDLNAFSQFEFPGGGQTLRLDFNGPNASVLYVDYQQAGYTLVRTNRTTNMATVVANHVTGFTAFACNNDGSPNSSGPCARIELTLTYPDPSSSRRLPNFSGTYVFIGVPPPP